MVFNCKFFFPVIFVFALGCSAPKKMFYNPNVMCQLKTADGKVILTSQVKYSSNKRSDKNNVINKMYRKLLFNGLRQNQCVLNQLIFDPNPEVNYGDFLNSFWLNKSKEGEFHKVLSRTKSKNQTTSYTVEFDINKLKKHLNENNIK